MAAHLSGVAGSGRRRGVWPTGARGEARARLGLRRRAARPGRRITGGRRAALLTAPRLCFYRTAMGHCRTIAVGAALLFGCETTPPPQTVAGPTGPTGP